MFSSNFSQDDKTENDLSQLKSRTASDRARAKRTNAMASKSSALGPPLTTKGAYRSDRSWTMAQVRSKNTTPEMAVRKAAHALGLRFRLHCSSLPGKPDLVFRRWRTVLFVNGCFWHSHYCERSRIPKTNVDYWTKKLERNVLRDKETIKVLRKAGWRCAVIWECQAKDPARLNRILHRLFASDRRC